MKTELKSFDFTIEYFGNQAALAYNADNAQIFETILDTFDYKDIGATEWKSIYNEYISYDCEPHCLDGFMKHRRLKFKSEEHIKFFLYLLNNYIDNIKQAQVSYNAEDTIKEVNNYNEIS